MQNVLVIVTDSPGRTLIGESSGEWTCWGREASKMRLRANLEIVTINTSFPTSGSSAAGMLLQNVPNWRKEPCLTILMLTHPRKWAALRKWFWARWPSPDEGHSPRETKLKAAAANTVSSKGSTWLVPRRILSIIFYGLLGHCYPLNKLVIKSELSSAKQRSKN